MAPPHDHPPNSTAAPLAADREQAMARLDRLAWLLDSALRVPGTSLRFGADAASNLLPVVGPLISKGVSAWLILEATRLGVPRPLVLRMVGHVALDAAIGAVPLLGWTADIFLRANRRNMALLREHLARSPPTTPPPAVPTTRNLLALRSPG